MRRSPAILLFVLLAAVVASWLVAGPFGREQPIPTPAPVARQDPGEADATPPVHLRGRPRLPRPPASPTPSTPGAPKPEDVAAGRVLPASLPETVADRWKHDDPRFPQRPHHPDPDLGDPHRAPHYLRLDLLGRPVDGLGPWLPDGRELAWAGMARVVSDDAQAIDAKDAIEEPLVTAVVGRVTSGATPLAGAEVILYSTFYQRHARYDHHVREVGRTTTHVDGVFDLRPVGLDTVHFGADGEVLLTVHRPGFGSIVARRLDNIRPEVENDLGAFDMQPVSATLHGVIRDFSGDPVAGAAVRVSGSVNPVIYDKTERMIILKDCPTAVTDAEGRYRLEGFALGRQHVSVHVNIDCVQHFATTYDSGEHEWSPRVRAGGSVRGRVVDGRGDPVAGAVVAGGDNWTPSNPDGTFWLDNIDAGPFTLHVAHHALASVYLPGVTAGTEDLEVVMATPLPRIRLRVTAADTGEPLRVVAIDWTWPGGGPPHLFVPDSPYWHDAGGHFEVIVPESAVGAWVSAEGRTGQGLEPADLEDGREVEIELAVPGGD